jgi:hypothetical protein
MQNAYFEIGIGKNVAISIDYRPIRVIVPAFWSMKNSFFKRREYDCLLWTELRKVWGLYRLPGCSSVFLGLIIVSAINAALWERRPAAMLPCGSGVPPR